MREQRKLIKWIKNHKKALIITGISVAALIAVVLGIKHKDALQEVWASLRKAVAKPVSLVIKQTSVTSVVTTVAPMVEEASATAICNADSLPFEVSRHIRNLSGGKHASAEKIAAAMEQHIILQESQTWVEAYMKETAA